MLAEGATLKYRDLDRDVFACRSIDLAVRPGEFLGILGPSGSGKSSLLYLLSGLKLPSAGSVRFKGADYARMNDAQRGSVRLNELGFVFQQPYLIGYLSALENVLAVEKGDAAQATELLERLGLASEAHRLPHELSTGQRQRVCVARALSGSPLVVFADEPTASLDHENGVQVVELMNRNRGDGALVMVTHDPSMLGSADRIVRIEDGRLFDADPISSA